MDGHPQSAPGASEASLRYVADGADQTMALAADPDRRVVIGRRRRADLRLRAAGVSREHAYVLFDGGHWTFHDTSRYGSSVNGERVRRHRLVDGDRLLIGQVELTFVGPADGLDLDISEYSGTGETAPPPDWWRSRMSAMQLGVLVELCRPELEYPSPDVGQPRLATNTVIAGAVPCDLSTVRKAVNELSELFGLPRIEDGAFRRSIGSFALQERVVTVDDL